MGGAANERRGPAYVALPATTLAALDRRAAGATTRSAVLRRCLARGLTLLTGKEVCR